MERLFSTKNLEQMNEKEVMELLGKAKKLVEELESRLGESEEVKKIKSKLDEINFGITELNERMDKPYIMPNELGEVYDGLDILAENGRTNILLLSGEPGTGKTASVYYKVGEELKQGLDSMLIHVRVKPNMTAEELLYTVDEVKRLSDAQAKVVLPEEIVKESKEWRRKILTGEVEVDDEDYLKFKKKMDAIIELSESGKDLNYSNYIKLGPLGEAIQQSANGKKVWLLFDEAEKGPEELLNGILDEVEHLSFKISETGDEITGDREKLRIILTTNLEDEDKISPAFRRRSVYFSMPSLSSVELAEVVRLEFPEINDELLDYAISVYENLVNNDEIEKKPSTPELISWIQLLSKNYKDKIPEGVPYIELLLKTREDQDLDIFENSLSWRESVNEKMRMPDFVHKAFQGENVFRIKQEDIDNNPDRYEEFFAGLVNLGISFQTPCYGERRVWDDYEQEYVTEEYLDKNFMILEPGIEILGDGYYVFGSQEYQEIFKSILENKVEVLSEGQVFESVHENNDKYIYGKIMIDGELFDAYMDKKTKKVAVIKNI